MESVQHSRNHGRLRSSWSMGLFIIGGMMAAPNLVRAQSRDNTRQADEQIVAGKRLLPGLTLRITTSEACYEQGTAIPITMHYTYTGARKLNVEAITYDRCGRIPELQFRAVIASGTATDPVPLLSGSEGGIRMILPLTPYHPYEQTVILNEWLHFDQPGHYFVTLRSTAVEFDEPRTFRPIPLESQPLEIEITPPDDEHRRQRLERGRLALESQYETAQERTMRDLRFMVDPRAIPLLIRGLQSPFSNAALEALFGLQSFADMGPVLTALQQRMSDPASGLEAGQEVDYGLLLAYAQLRAAGHTIHDDSRRYLALTDRWMETFRAALAARERAGPDLFVCSYDDGSVRRISATGRDLGDIVMRIGKPADIAVGPDGNLYIIDSVARKVRRFSPAGKNLGVFVRRGLTSPRKLAFDTQGNLYIAESDRIQRYSPTGKYLGVFTDRSIHNACGMAFDRAGNLCVSNFNSGAVRKFARDGTDLGDFAKSPGLTPKGLAFDRQGHLYVADYNRNAIRKFAPDGTDEGDFVDRNLDLPNGLAFDTAGNLYVAHGGDEKRYSPEGWGAKRFSAQGKYLGELQANRPLATSLAFGALPGR